VIFSQLWSELLPVGRIEQTGGYRRYSWTEPDAACRGWFVRTAAALGLRTDCDRNGNLWAWWNAGSSGPAVATGSHLDSVPDGGAFDGPLGIVSAFAAIAQLRASGFRPARPIAVAAFTEEEGGRFGVACLGSRLLTGAIDPAAARGLRDSGGVSLAEAMRAAGRDPALISLTIPASTCSSGALASSQACTAELIAFAAPGSATTLPKVASALLAAATILAARTDAANGSIGSRRSGRRVVPA